MGENLFLQIIKREKKFLRKEFKIVKLTLWYTHVFSYFPCKVKDLGNHMILFLSL